MLSDAKFLDSLLNFDKDNIPEKVIENIRKNYLTKPDFDPEKMKKVSAACEGLCRWVMAISEYDKVAKVVAPKKKALAEAEATYSEALYELNVKRKQLQEVQVCRQFKNSRFLTFLFHFIHVLQICIFHSLPLSLLGQIVYFGKIVKSKKSRLSSNVRSSRRMRIKDKTRRRSYWWIRRRIQSLVAKCSRTRR